MNVPLFKPHNLLAYLFNFCKTQYSCHSLLRAIGMGLWTFSDDRNMSKIKHYANITSLKVKINSNAAEKFSTPSRIFFFFYILFVHVTEFWFIESCRHGLALEFGLQEIYNAVVQLKCLDKNVARNIRHRPKHCFCNANNSRILAIESRNGCGVGRANISLVMDEPGRAKQTCHPSVEFW